MATTPIFLPGEFNGQREEPGSHKESDTIEQLTLSLSFFSQTTLFVRYLLKEVPCTLFTFILCFYKG